MSHVSLVVEWERKVWRLEIKSPSTATAKLFSDSEGKSTKDWDKSGFSFTSSFLILFPLLLATSQQETEGKEEKKKG